ncbi:hypothetical protein MMPV_001094 [Pyropia vietnamensis]
MVTPSTLNMCSTCFRDHQKHENPQNGAETAASSMAAAAAAAAASIAAASAAVKSASPPPRVSDGSAPHLLLPPNVASGHQLLRPTTPPSTATNLADAVTAAEAASTVSLESSTTAAAAATAGSPPRLSAVATAAPMTPPAGFHPPASAASQLAAPPSPPALKRKASYPRADADMAIPSDASMASAAPPADEEPGLPARKVQKDKRRCFSCRKKVGLTALPCRCGYIYCSAHRMATDHGCDFDYKTHARSVLAGANPLVAAVKVNKI